MNAQSNNLTRIAAALVLAMACGNTWAAGNSITFEGADTAGAATGNGKGNKGNIDASGANSAGTMNVKIKQVSSSAAGAAGELNQVGDYGAATGSGKVLTLTNGAAGNLTVNIGQGATITSGSFDADAGNTKASANNLVTGKISATTTTTVNISQIGNKAGSRAVHLGVDADGTSNGVGVTGGTLNANQAGQNQVLIVKNYVGGTTTVNQTSTANNSNLTLDNNGAGASGYTATINQKGAYQNADVQFIHTGYNGTVNLESAGVSGTPTTLDVKM